MNKRDRFLEGFNTRARGSIDISKINIITIIINKNFLFANVPNGNISQQQQQQQTLIWGKMVDAQVEVGVINKMASMD